MKTKTKLTIGVGALFALIILLAAVSTYSVNSLKDDTNNILTANYNTLEYSRNMLMALDEVHTDKAAFSRFETNLRQQLANVTEMGEREVTQRIADHFERLRGNPDDNAAYADVRADIAELMRLNMDAIVRKSETARKTADSATIWISVTGAGCFLIAFILLVNLPGNIANPIRELTESIKQIAAQRYGERVHFEGHSEFGELARSFNTMAQKLEEYANSKLDKLLMEKKRIDTLIENMHDPVIGIDEHGKILFANSEAVAVTGLDKQGLVGNMITQLAIENDLLRTLARKPAEPDNRESTKPIKVFADGKESYFERETIDIDISPTGEQETRRIGSVILLRNITPFKELDSAKTNFIATVSHELKTPISSIKMSLDLLEHQTTGRLNEDQRQLIESIRDDSERLLRITGELVDMSRLESGHIQLNKQPSDPMAILDYTLGAVGNQAVQRGIELVTEVDADLPIIDVDAEKTAWVLTNFMTNAIRYSPDNGRVIISVKKSERVLRYSVQDFGKGIERRYRDRIFDRYFQVPGSNKAGTGLGLAISKDFIENQGGRIGVDSEPGLGSTFFFELPC
ncbi:PAS domain-containing sensor histidine kinase [Parapedobacter pyrenivorans]|uniref:histidine kinase n=1 Tax=Parapedobacter pyrenivorans TaxID=1305674 RepID=A0A917HWS6_9SPHI|nr:ATP-binding protein [Parapedobacter pyrenivorans]GGG94605.1 PAS domain-containing sensor histidine kinase [Parapedobacter pyrenivorans]